MECVTSLLFLRGKFGQISSIRCTCIRTKYFGLRQKTRFLVSKLFKFSFSFLRCAPPCHCCRSPLFPFYDIRIHVLNGEPNIYYITTLVGRVTILFPFFSRISIEWNAFSSYWQPFRLFSIFQYQGWRWRTSKIYDIRGDRWFTSAPGVERVINWKLRYEGIKGSNAESSQDKAVKFVGKSSLIGSS